jgi:hypothetical protein
MKNVGNTSTNPLYYAFLKKVVAMGISLMLQNRAVEITRWREKMFKIINKTTTSKAKKLIINNNIITINNKKINKIKIKIFTKILLKKMIYSKIPFYLIFYTIKKKIVLMKMIKLLNLN